MKIYMYNKDEAIKNNVIYKFNPIVRFVIFMILDICLLFGTIFYSSYITVYVKQNALGKIYSLVPWIILISFTIFYYIIFMKNLRLKYWAPNVAFIKENDVLWAVKLTYLHFAYVADNDSPASFGPAIESACENQMMTAELKEKRVHSENYVNALEDAKKEKNIFKDMDKNFTFVFNGTESVIRLDDIEFKEEKKKTEVYTYKNYLGERVDFEIVKAYPGLKNEVSKTFHVSHGYPFPKKYEGTYKNNPLAILLIILAIYFIIPVLVAIFKH